MIGTKVLEEKNSKFNGNLCVVKTLGMGTYIQAGGLTQSGGIVESIWKQTLRHLNNKKIFTESESTKPLIMNNCLILGLGGGTVAKLIRKNWPEASLTGVEIDPVMVELGKKYLGLDRLNTDIKITDAARYIKNDTLNTKYDLIIVDLYRGDKFPERFETEDYTRLIGNKLSKSGVAVFNRLYYGDKRPEAVKFGRKLEKIFSEVAWFYPEANLMFLCSNRA